MSVLFGLQCSIIIFLIHLLARCSIIQDDTLKSSATSIKWPPSILLMLFPLELGQSAFLKNFHMFIIIT